MAAAPPPAITARTLELLAGAVASVSAFDCRFPVTAWFGLDDARGGRG